MSLSKDLVKYFIKALLLCVTISVANEQHCSRFHYEEKLLEKMVRMEVRMEEIEKKLENAAKHNGFVKHEIQDLKSKYNNNHVAFFARAQHHQLSMSKDKTIVFETVVTNVDKSYDHSCGKFVAPKSGIYVFFSTVLGHNNARILLKVAVNDTGIVNLYAHGQSGGHDAAGVTVTLQLNTGDVVTIKNDHDGGNIHGNGYSSFGGFLLV